MSLRNSLFFVIATTCYGQATLGNFWEMNVAQSDKLAWDSHGTAVAYGGDITAQTTIFGGGITSTRRLGMNTPTSLIDRSSSYTFGVWTIQSGNASILFINGSLSLRFNTEPTGRPQVLLATSSGTETFTMSAPFTCANAAKCLVWVAWDATAGQIKLARNDSTWESFTPTGTFFSTAGEILEFAEGSGSGSGPYFSPTVGRTMFFTGIADDSQRSAIYNGGNGQPYTYFNPAGYTPPTRPLSVSYHGVFASDANLTDQGLYWLRPWKVSDGVYFWVRSTDHQSSAFAKGGIYGAYSASPAVFPDDSSWSLLFNSDLLSSSDPTDDWLQAETPHLVWNPDTNLWHMYCHAISVSNTSNQSTHLLTSPDLVTWTWVNVVLPIDESTNRNHTGYAVVSRLSSDNWVALSNNPGPGPFSYFLWSSTDGITWQPERHTYGNVLNNSSFAYGVSYSLSTDLSKAFWNSVSNTVNQSSFTLYEPQYWHWPLFEHDGTGTGGDWLQDVRAYEENCTVYLYAKWNLQEPSTTRLYTGTLNGCTPTVETPIGLQWPDRRPIGAMFIGDGAKTSENPRGYNVGGSPDFVGAGFETAKAALLSKIENQYIANADQYSPKPQALMIWDLEGQEFQHIFTYVGAPQALSVLSPEMDLMADDIMALIRSRGYEPGLTLRPHRFSSGTGRPTGACLNQGAYDGQVYIDTSASYPNRGYRCGPGTVTFPSGSTVQVAGEFAVNYQSGSVVRFVSSGTLPSPLVQIDNYYLCSWDNEAQTFTVATDSGCSSVISSYSGGSGTHTMMSWRGPVNLPVQELPADLEDALAHIKTKIDYARQRWGIKYFYVDSTYYCAHATCQTNTVLPNDGFWSVLHEDYPDTVFMPENSPSGEYTAKYLSFDNGDYGPAGSSIVVPHIQDRSPGYSDWRASIQAHIESGVPYVVTVNTAPANSTELYRQDLLAALETARTITMTDRGQTRTFRSNPGAAFTYPLTGRVYFASTPEGLAASNTWCERKGGDRCYLNGVLQDTAALDLSALGYYQIRYYDFAGGLVSNPGTYATIQ